MVIGHTLGKEMDQMFVYLFLVVILETFET